jgi:hypothetical protein
MISSLNIESVRVYALSIPNLLFHHYFLVEEKKINSEHELKIVYCLTIHVYNIIKYLMFKSKRVHVFQINHCLILLYRSIKNLEQCYYILYTC